MNILRVILYIAIVFAAMSYFVFGYEPWADDNIVDASDISWDTEIEGGIMPWNYDPNKTVFAYSSELSKLLQLEDDKAIPLPEHVYAVRVYSFPSADGAIGKLQFYIDAKDTVHLPNTMATTRAYEQTYVGFLGFQEDSSKESPEMRENIDKFFDDHKAVFKSQIIAQSIDGTAKSVAIDRYTKDLMPGMALLDVETGFGANTDTFYIYAGRGAPTKEYTDKVIDALSNGKTLSDQAQKDFIKIELPKLIRDFLVAHCNKENECTR